MQYYGSFNQFHSIVDCNWFLKQIWRRKAYIDCKLKNWYYFCLVGRSRCKKWVKSYYRHSGFQCSLPYKCSIVSKKIVRWLLLNFHSATLSTFEPLVPQQSKHIKQPESNTNTERRCSSDHIKNGRCKQSTRFIEFIGVEQFA